MSFDPITPKIAVDIALVHGRRILSIQRKFPPLGHALPGGFVEVGETLMDAAIRECQEETSIIISPDQMRSLGYLDAPDRDPRRHVISFGFLAHLSAVQAETAKAADDAASFEWVDLFDFAKYGVDFVMQHDIFVRRASGTILMVPGQHFPPSKL